MPNPPFLHRGVTAILIFFFATQLVAQIPSSIYLDSKVVADFLRKEVKPSLDFSNLPDTTRAKVRIISQENKEVPIPPDGILPINPDVSFQTLILQLGPNDTIFANGTYSYSITSNSLDTIFLYWYNRLGVEYPNTEVNDYAFIYYAGSFDQAVEIVQRLGFHHFYNQEFIPGGNFFYHEVKDAYSENPFTAQKIMSRPAFKDFDTDFDLFFEFNNFKPSLKSSYPWQSILNRDSVLNFSQQVSYETEQGSYRDQIVTSEKALTLASEQIHRSGQSGGFLDAQTVAVGLSDFIAERAQEELNLTFFERFKTNMQDTNELTVLFPYTRDLLFDFEISNYKTLLSHARGAFETDLSNIGLNFPKVLSLKKYERLRNDPNVFNLALIYSLADLAYKEHPVEDLILYACQMIDDRKNRVA